MTTINQALLDINNDMCIEEQYNDAWAHLQQAFDLWTVRVVKAWAGTLSSPNSHMWQRFVHNHGLHGAHLIRVTFDELRDMGCPDIETFWHHVLNWRYVITVPAAHLVSEKGIHRHIPAAMARDWIYAQNRLACDFGLA